ncbi:MAG: ROK family protein [Bacillota bacterium]|nr:ROK family protein [Bacillota bacterium]
MYRVGIDLGGTNIASGVTDDKGKLIVKASVPTEASSGRERVCALIRESAEQALYKGGLGFSDIETVGLGFPGTVERNKKALLNAVNLPCLNGVPLKGIFPEFPETRLFVENDANAAALGELVAGSGKNKKSLVMITLGTGLGGGIIIDGRIYSGFNGCAGEVGHMVINKGGRECSCGRKGCFEKYASATGLITTTIEEMNKNKASLLWELCENDPQKVTGRTAFEAMRKGDNSGRAAVSRYLGDLSLGVVNIISMFQPEVFAISGGISNEGDALLIPLRALCEKERFNTNGAYTEIMLASCKDSGIVGAAMLFSQMR